MEQLEEVERLPGEVAADADQVVQENVSLEAVDELASPADEEPEREEYLICKVEAGETRVANEVLEDALNVELCCENAETVQVGTDDAYVMDNCRVCDLLVNEQFDYVLGGIHGRKVDKYLDGLIVHEYVVGGTLSRVTNLNIGQMSVGVYEADVAPPKSGQPDEADGD